LESPYRFLLPHKEVFQRRQAHRIFSGHGVYHRGMDRCSHLAAFVLAGGKSSRMGTDKAFLEYRGRPLVEHAIALAGSLSSAVRVVGSREKFGRYGLVVEDIFPGQGPLGGIHAALCVSRADLNLMIAVDMPLLSQPFLQYLIDRARGSTAIVTVPRTDRRWHPLCAVYRSSFVTLAEEALKAGKNKIGSLFDMTQTLTIEEEELTSAGFSPSLFLNLNTPQELWQLARTNSAGESGQEKRS
jgi:molybdenum cofactor guanylyltransferase